MAIVMCAVKKICVASVYFLTEASFNQGLNPHIYVTYRHAAGSLVMFPFAYFLERVSLTLNLYFASMRYVSPTFMTAIINTIPCTTFIIAVILRLEIVGVRSPRGIAKIVGTLTSLVGVIVIAFYKGPAVASLKGAPIHLGTNSVLENWLKGSILTLASRMLWSSFYITQGAVSSCLNVFIPLWCIEQKGPVFVTIFNPLITVIVAIAAYFLVGEKLYTGW
ncbi:hypothetical protein WN944_016731 [Citrus x changshan-huyou]|uniref:WAT1-related protein n=1 Tax=Citrus x changshan-huyou TaxID=2935761 RepID=A0AAP0MBK5_9ROSI